jgi:hypothetical protein
VEASATLEAPNEEAADEARDALDGGTPGDPEEMSAHARAKAAAETGQTSEERAETRAPAARGEIDGISWDEIIGGELPTEEAMVFAGTAFKVMEVPAGGLKKGAEYIMVLSVKAVGHSVMDSLDSETGDVSKTKLTKKVRVRSARFLAADEVIVTDPELAAQVAAAKSIEDAE